MFTLRFFIHYGLHFLAPVGIAYLYDVKTWKKNTLILLSTMLIDLDHLLATPIYDANRCSINYHVLHSTPFIYLYVFLLVFKKTRILSVGILFHLLTDFIDCYLH